MRETLKEWTAFKDDVWRGQWYLLYAALPRSHEAGPAEAGPSLAPPLPRGCV